MTDNRETEWIQPWSPLLMRSQLSDKAVTALLSITDKLVGNSASESWGHNLAGQIKDELKINHDLLENTMVDTDTSVFNCIMGYIQEYSNKALHQYATDQRWDSFLTGEWKTVMNSCWVVSQQPGEYNPIHTHTHCNISGVLYLKVPQFDESIKTKTDDDGCIVFMGGASAGQDSTFVKNTYTWKPRVGDIFVFPSYLAHAVWPYECSSGDPERRSISFNADLMTEQAYADKFKK